MTIAVIDGQGGRLGAMVIEALRKAGVGAPHRIAAVGTNAMATAAMMKAQADQGATGENPVKVVARDADILVGPIGLLMADALLGEITESMAAAVGRSRAVKILIPTTRCGCRVAGTGNLPLGRLGEHAVQMVMETLAGGGEA